MQKNEIIYILNPKTYSNNFFGTRTKKYFFIFELDKENIYGFWIGSSGERYLNQKVRLVEKIITNKTRISYINVSALIKLPKVAGYMFNPKILIKNTEKDILYDLNVKIKSWNNKWDKNLIMDLNLINQKRILNQKDYLQKINTMIRINKKK